MLFGPPPHSGGPLSPHDLVTAWDFNLWLLVPLTLTVFVYSAGVWNLWRSAGRGHGISVRRVLCFTGAVLALLLALISPLDALAGALFSAHMVQHMVLILLAAPLLVMSDFPVALMWAFRRGWGQRIGQKWNRSSKASKAWQVLSSPISAWILFSLSMWIWHASRLYEAALQNETVHTLEHVMFLSTAMLFWWVLLRQSTQTHIQYGIAIPYLFTTVLQSGVLGALMTFSSRPWYSSYDESLVTPWGLTPLQDQQIAGLIMWIPVGLIFTLLAIGYFAAWLRALEERSQRLAHTDYRRTRQEIK